MVAERRWYPAAAGMVEKAAAWVARIGRWVAPPVARIALALPFLRSGMTRWDPFPDLSIGTQFLFEEIFKLHLFGAEVALPAPLFLAYVTAVAEIVLPVLLILGLGTRFVALGLLIMTGVIQLIVPDGWINFHLIWAALALSIMAMGPGPLAIDTLIGKLCRRNDGMAG